jgi:hypothetical protein
VLRKLWSTSKDEGWSSKNGELLIQRPTPRVVCFVEKGHLGSNFAPRIIGAMQAALSPPQNRPFFFVDAERVDSYDPAIQDETTNWLLQNRGLIVCAHMLVRSAVTRTGMSAIGRSLGAILVGHTVRGSFEAALRDAIDRTRPAYAPPP